jgi:hypothetical protein
VAQEKRMAARMANAPATEHNMNAGDEYRDLIRKWMNDEKNGFSEWCAVIQSAEQKTGKPLTSEEVFIFTGQPDEESPLTQGGVDGKVWTWSAEGPFSGAVMFGISFARSAGSNGSWSFIGCAWCVAGGVVAPRGCVDLPWRP